MRRVALKARYIIDSLQVFILGTESGCPVTWKEACIKSSINNYSNMCWRTIMCWYHNILKTMTGNLCFTKLIRGASSSIAYSLFLEDKSLQIEFKSCSCANLEKLTVNHETEWTNEKSSVWVVCK